VGQRVDAEGRVVDEYRAPEESHDEAGQPLIM
jgi:hypothetical protein